MEEHILYTVLRMSHVLISFILSLDYVNHLQRKGKAHVPGNPSIYVSGPRSDKVSLPSMPYGTLQGSNKLFSSLSLQSAFVWCLNCVSKLFIFASTLLWKMVFRWLLFPSPVHCMAVLVNVAGIPSEHMANLFLPSDACFLSSYWAFKRDLSRTLEERPYNKQT